MASALIDMAKSAIMMLPTWSYDFQELLTDVEYAKLYRYEIKNFLLAVKELPCPSLIKELQHALARLNRELEPLLQNGMVRDRFLEDANLLSRIGASIAKLAKVNIADINALFALQSPRWYRQELASHVNNLNIVMDKIFMMLQDTERKSCPLTEDIVKKIAPDIKALPNATTLNRIARAFVDLQRDIAFGIGAQQPQHQQQQQPQRPQRPSKSVRRDIPVPSTRRERKILRSIRHNELKRLRTAKASPALLSARQVEQATLLY
jgi:hypothetical protein